MGPTQHPYCRFLYARHGSIRIETARRSLFVPPRFGLWIPPDVQHTLDVTSAVTLEFLYVAEGVLGECLDAQLSVVELNEFAAAFIHHVCTAVPLDYEADSSALRRIQVLIDVLGEMPDADLAIALPLEPRLAGICRSIQSDPGAPHLLEEWASRLAMSPRTLARHFVAETGLTFQAWRQNLRLIASLGLLRAGVSVSTTALEMGYSTPSAFIFAFKKKFGLPPTGYLGS